MHFLLSDLREACVLGQIRDVAVHFPVDFDVLDHLAAVGLETAVHVVELDARDLAGGSVEKLGRKILGELVVLTVLLPAGHHVVAFLRDFLVQAGDLVGGVLQVGVHGDDHVALRLVETAVQRSGFAVVAPEADAVHQRIGRRKALDNLPGGIGAAVVDHYYLVGIAFGEHDPLNPGFELGKGFRFVEQGNDY